MQEMNKKLLTTEQRMDGYHWKFDTDAILRADAGTRAEVNFKAIRSGWRTPNEVRMEYGHPADANGDDLMVSKDLIPLRLLERLAELEQKGNGEQDGSTETDTESSTEHRAGGRNGRSGADQSAVEDTTDR